MVQWYSGTVCALCALGSPRAWVRTLSGDWASTLGNVPLVTVGGVSERRGGLHPVGGGLLYPIHSHENAHFVQIIKKNQTLQLKDMKSKTRNHLIHNETLHYILKCPMKCNKH